MAWLRNERDGESTWVSCTPPSPVPMTRGEGGGRGVKDSVPGAGCACAGRAFWGQQNYRAEAYMGCGETELASKN